jgi:uncharacterized protein
LRILHARGFLVSKGADEIELLRLHYLSARHSSDLLSVNIVPTMACNLRCPYCFEGKAQTAAGAGQMSHRTQDAAVRYILESSREKKKVRLIWFGGEPLLAMRVIERMCSQLLPALRQARIECVQTVVTNGTLLSAQAARRLAACRVGFAQVTVDIPRGTKQDRRGRDTLGQVLDNMRAAAARIQLYLRINMVHDDEAEFDQLYQGLLKRKLQTKLKTVMMAHVLEPECGRPGCDFRRLPQRTYVQVMRRERSKARAMGIPMEVLSTTGGSACAATCRQSAAIDPQGLVYKCVEDLGLGGRAHASVFDPSRVNLANVLPWMKYDWFQYPRCRKCPVLPQCAGGCPHKRLYQSATWKGDDFCYWHMRGDLENRIREHVLQAGLSNLQAPPFSPQGA